MLFLLLMLLLLLLLLIGIFHMNNNSYNMDLPSLTTLFTLGSTSQGGPLDVVRCRQSGGTGNAPRGNSVEAEGLRDWAGG